AHDRMHMIYLDHAATTVPRDESRAVLGRWLDPQAGLGNASSAHAAGRRARLVVEEAREQIAAALGASPNDIVFTSGGTEADNLAVKGLAWAAAERGRRHLVTSAVEHPAVLDSVRWLAQHDGFTLTVVPPQFDGRVEVERVLAAVRDDTAVVSVMAANNELGAINDVAALGGALRERGVSCHVDAVQAYASLDVDVTAWPIDALALSAHKFGGPGGVGIAYLRRGVPVVPLSHGGGQDRGVRSGTFAAALDAACAAAATAAAADRPTLRGRLRELAERLATGLMEVGGVRHNGPAEPDWRLASHVHVSVQGVDAEALLFALDQAGLCVSTGSACHSGANRASHVLAATGLDDLASVRASLGWTTTRDQIDAAVEIFAEAVRKLRAVGGGGVR
ncbi:MAG: cysteine desulfurase, partial [Actinomycetota bacterium]|nr:cysteine desulfurase [Actinomycetota bacterium]